VPRLPKPKPDHKPVIGRRVEKLACVCVLSTNETGVKIGACADLVRHIQDLQRANVDKVRLGAAFWVPDMSVASRVVSRASAELRARGSHIRGDWFSVSPAVAAAAIRTAAHMAQIPLMAHRDYLEICRSPEELDNLEMDDYLRSLGIPA
jgi:hypothetical protein